MAGAQQIRVHRFSTPQEIANRFLLLARNVNWGEGAGAIQDSELPRITPIGLDAIARTTRNQGRRDHLAGHVVRSEKPLQREATGAGFITTPHRSVF
jgi:hypothetical protein